MESATKSNQQFCLRWHNHQASLLTSLPLLLNQSSLTDVTLSAEGKTLQAHRVVLSACSNFFAELFRNLEQSYHPVIILPGAKFAAVVALVSFMYSGETNVFEEQIPGLLILAEALGIKGLADLNHNNIQNVNNKISKMNEDKVQMYQFETKTNEDNTSLTPNIFPKKCIYSNVVPEDEFKITSNLLSNCEQYYNYLNRNQENQKNTEENSINQNDILQEDKKIINNFNQISEIIRCLTSSSIAVNNFANELSIMKSCSEKSGNSIAEKKSEEDVNFYEETLCVDNTVISKNGLAKPNSTTIDSGRNKNLTGVEAIKPSTNSKLYATCFICQKQLSNQYNLRVHLETHQNVRYSCNVCPHVSRSKDALRKHVSYRHSTNMNCFEIEPKKKRPKLINLGSDSSVPSVPLIESDIKLDCSNDEGKNDNFKTHGISGLQKKTAYQSPSKGAVQIQDKPLQSHLDNSRNNNTTNLKTIDKTINDIKSESN